MIITKEIEDTIQQINIELTLSFLPFYTQES